MCLAAGVPLVESGTAGYLGQVQPIIKVRFLELITYPRSSYGSDHIRVLLSRIAQNVLIVRQNQLPNLFPCAQSALRPHNPSTAPTIPAMSPDRKNTQATSTIHPASLVSTTCHSPALLELVNMKLTRVLIGTSG